MVNWVYTCLLAHTIIFNKILHTVKIIMVFASFSVRFCMSYFACRCIFDELIVVLTTSAIQTAADLSCYILYNFPHNNNTKNYFIKIEFDGFRCQCPKLIFWLQHNTIGSLIKKKRLLQLDLFENSFCEHWKKKRAERCFFLICW